MIILFVGKLKIVGYFVMNDNFFDEFVLEVMIDKKYLTEEELALFKQKPILFDMDDPF